MPSARVWPPIPDDTKHAASSWETFGNTSATVAGEVANNSHAINSKASELPSLEHQKTLLDLYFTYVHPIMPILHKGLFYERLNYT
jgi:hypothetical protein